MPSHMGIKLSLVSQWELQTHPEFAHPDSSQLSVRSPNVNNSPLLGLASDSETPDSKSDRILGRQSTVAVYIPSVSGARFWIRYSITETAAKISPWYYFKLFMNGRHITSWGANSITKPNGQVMRGFFDPSEKWNYKDNGTVYKNNGTEVRPFFFTKECVNRTAAEDGGLIEVLVFRARGRRRRVPKPEEYKSQEKWGVVSVLHCAGSDGADVDSMPTGGLLEKPQDAKFYDWHLQDPQDKPFITFQFHYRSWDSLISLQLIPADHTRSLLPASPSLLSLNGYSGELQEPPEEDEDIEIRIRVDEVEQEEEPGDSVSSENSYTPWMTTVFDDSPNEPAALFTIPRTVSSYPLPISKFSAGARDDDPVERSSSPDIRNRPLPEIPVRGASLNHGHHSRSSSSLSQAVSITPSLRSYFERERHSMSPEPIIGVASVMNVVASTFGLSSDLEKVDRDSALGVEASSPSEHSSVSPITPLKRPLGAVFNLSMPNVTVRKHRRSSPKKHLSLIKQSPVLPSETSQSDEDESHKDDHAEENKEEANDVDAEPSALDNNMTSLSLTESEWMCRTPSPIRHNPERGRAEQMWSPGLEKHSFRNSLDGSVLRKRASNIDGRDSEEVEDDLVIDEGMNVRKGDEVKIRSGNWI